MTFCLNLRKFLQVCRNLRTFVAVPENLRFTHLGAKKTVNLGFRAKKTEFPAMAGPTKSDDGTFQGLSKDVAPTKSLSTCLRR